MAKDIPTVKIFAIAAVSLVLAAFGVSAQETWPSRPGKVVVPYPAGGATDVMGRFASVLRLS